MNNDAEEMGMKMKIGIVYLGRFLDGDNLSAASRRVRDIARGLAIQGHEVSVIVPRREAVETDTKMDGIHVRYIGGLGNRIVRRLRYWKELSILSHREQFDWMMFYAIRADVYLAMQWLKKKRAKLATIISDKHSAVSGMRDYHRWVLGLSIKIGETLQPKASDLNICISQNLMDLCQKNAPAVPNILLPVLVDTDRFFPSEEGKKNANKKWNLSKDEIVIAYLGGLWKHHGVRDLMTAFSQIACDYPNIRLLIAGQMVSAETHDNVVEISQELNLEKKIILTGWVNTQDVIELYNRVDILTLPQHDVEAVNAGLPTKIAEYAAMGKAIVASQTSDIEAYFTDHSDVLLFESRNIEALKATLVELIENAKLREKIGKAAAETAGRVFDYQVACKPLSNYLDNSLSREAVCK